MLSIWKYELQVTDEQTIDLPASARILCVDTQGGGGSEFGYFGQRICLWALVNPSDVKRPVTFRLFGTGHQVPEEFSAAPWYYVGTIQLRGGALIFHVFMKTGQERG